jgi:hypothetical protein
VRIEQNDKNIFGLILKSYSILQFRILINEKERRKLSFIGPIQSELLAKVITE